MNDPRQRMTPEQKAALKVGHQLGQGFISDAELAERFTDMVEQSKKTFERDGYHAHMMMAWLRNNDTKESVLIPAMFADWPPPQGKKEETLMGVGVKFAEDNPNCTLITIAHVSEGWMADQDKFNASGKANINDMETDRIEVLTISLTTQDLRQSHTSLEIVRNPDETFSRWADKPRMESPYDPESDIHPMAEGDFLPMAVIKGYVMARSQERRNA